MSDMYAYDIYELSIIVWVICVKSFLATIMVSHVLWSTYNLLAMQIA